MKNISLKAGLIIILSVAICSVKAQSLQQKFQKDMELRKKHVEEVLLKVRQQQVQLKAEQRAQTNTPQQTITNNSAAKPNTQAIPVQQKRNETKTLLPSENKKPLTIQKTSINEPIKQE